MALRPLDPGPLGHTYLALALLAAAIQESTVWNAKCSWEIGKRCSGLFQAIGLEELVRGEQRKNQREGASSVRRALCDS